MHYKTFRVDARPAATQSCGAPGDRGLRARITKRPSTRPTKTRAQKSDACALKGPHRQPRIPHTSFIHTPTTDPLSSLLTEENVYHDAWTTNFFDWRWMHCLYQGNERRFYECGVGAYARPRSFSLGRRGQLRM